MVTRSAGAPAGEKKETIMPGRQIRDTPGNDDLPDVMFYVPWNLVGSK